MRRTFVQRLLKPPTSSSRLPFRLVQAQCKTDTAFFSQSHRATYQHQPYRSTALPDPYPVGPPRSDRVRRSLLWAVVFGTTGFTAMVLFMVAAYTQEGEIQPGTMADVLLLLRTHDLIRNHPVVQALLADPESEPHFPHAVAPEQEEKLILSTITGEDIECDPHFVYTSLKGHRGLHLVVFWNQLRHTLVMVIVPGFGLQGDITGAVHNGAVTTAIHESMQMVAKKWFPQGLTYNLSDLEVLPVLPVSIKRVCCITCHPAATIKPELLALGVDASTAEKASDVDIEDAEVVRWPEWFDPKDWNVMANSFVAQVQYAPSGHPAKHQNPVKYHAVGRYQVTDSEDWPPPQTLRRKAYYNIRD
ncbi:hypothetical protein PV11_05280 [Exophiala sideris]|uniref:Uncharacterized protein n=1 Tax=Exophiala sideris TaxID=1016849 RepID=A0A0D1Z8Z0_9EURO|nr:hypothetical protein PV11_05280 [Exophiala sideris]